MTYDLIDLTDTKIYHACSINPTYALDNNQILQQYGLDNVLFFAIYALEKNILYTNGELVQQQVPQKQVAEISIKDLPKGVYVVKMYSGKGVITTKFVKE